MGGWFRDEVTGLDDLQGLKMRAPGFAGEVMAKLGIAVTNIAPGELYTSLERGTIDALEWVGPALDLPMGFQKIAPWYYTGWHEPAAETQFLINAAVWKKLPEDLQSILKIAIKAAAYDMYAQSMHLNAKAWATMQAEYPDVKVRSFPPVVMDALKKANNELLEAMAKADPLSAEIIEAQKAYLADIREWTNISDRAYLDTASPAGKAANTQ
jgi:TRAP-type mannitol/chloroaromatic compound transport system substrate-binding protein